MGKKRKNIKFGKYLFFFSLLFFFVVGSKELIKYSKRTENVDTFHYLSIQPSHEKQTNYDVKFYNINLDVHFDPSLKYGQLNGIVEILFEMTKDFQTEIVLNFSSVLKIDSIIGAQNYHHENNLCKISFADNLKNGELKRIKIYYNGWPQPYHEWITGWKVTSYTSSENKKSPWLTTINPPYGAQTWFPCKDDPADKADSVKFQITVPDSLEVVCNGKLIGSFPHTENRKTVIWLEKYPIPPYLIAVNIAKYQIFQKVYKQPSGSSFPLQIYCFEEQAPFIKIIFSQLKSMLDFYTSVLGAYPFEKEKYAIASFSTVGGMENQTVSGVRGINPRNSVLYAHELAHQWFGNLVTPANFHQSWISEGLATYFTGLYIKHSEGNSAFRDYMKYHTSLTKGNVWVENTTNPDSIYHYETVYNKACWLFYMLHQRVGDRVFFQTIQRILKKYEYQTIDWKQLQEEFELTSDKELSQFFFQWIYGEYIPELDWVIYHAKDPSGEFQYNIQVKQRQPGKITFVLPVEVKFQSELAQDTTLIFEVFERKYQFNTFLPFLAKNIEIDPSNKIMMGSNLRKGGKIPQQIYSKHKVISSKIDKISN